MYMYNDLQGYTERYDVAEELWKKYIIKISYEEDYQGSRVSGCTNLEYYEMAEDTVYLNKWKLEGCNSLKTIIIPKGMKEIFANTFSRCKKPEKVIFKKFSNLENITGVKKLPWWRKQHTKKNGMVIYKNCLINTGKREGTLIIRGNKIKKIIAEFLLQNKSNLFFCWGYYHFNTSKQLTFRTYQRTLFKQYKNKRSIELYGSLDT